MSGGAWIRESSNCCELYSQGSGLSMIREKHLPILLRSSFCFVISCSTIFIELLETIQMIACRREGLSRWLRVTVWRRALMTSPCSSDQGASALARLANRIQPCLQQLVHTIEPGRTVIGPQIACGNALDMLYMITTLALANIVGHAGS